MNLRTTPHRSIALGAAAVATLACAPLHAATSIQFDFGNLNGSYSGTNAPAHVQGDLGVTATTWNTLTGDTTTGLLYTDGSAATGVTIDFGLATSATANVVWTDEPSGQTNGGANPSPGIYGEALMKDWLFTDGRNTSSNAGKGILAVRVSGLSAGEYSVYGLTREYSGLDRTYTVGIGVVTGSTTTLNSLMTSGLTDATGTTDWELGKNYATQTVTVNSPTDYVVYIVEDTTTGFFGSMNGLQIVAVPEPSVALLSSLGLLALLRRRRS